MSTFKVKTDLRPAVQRELDRILAISSGKRTTRESNFLTALAPYITNEIIMKDALGRIVMAAGLTVPVGMSGFKKGAVFTKKDASNEGRYVNRGTETTASWNDVSSANSPSPSDSPSSSESSSSSPSDRKSVV